MQLSDSVIRLSSKHLLERIGQHLAEKRLPVRVRLWTGEEYGPAANVETEIALRTPHALLALANPNLGNLARSYVEQEIDLRGDTRRIVQLGELLCGTAAGDAARTHRPLRWRRHTKPADRRAIGYHYDVSNEFYRLWLDERLVYSCAYFKSDRDTLDTAQRQKLDHICRKLVLQPGERLLDIGCGWGALVMHAAQHYGVRAVGVTLSRNQHEYAAAQIRECGLEDRCEVRFMDYRDVPESEPYDKIASVGMFEHVGIDQFPVYFGKIRRLLKPGGLLMNHGITSMSAGSAGAGPDLSGFIDEYVFPGGELAHVSQVIAAMAEQGLECCDAESLRPHYAKTLWQWVSRLEARKAEAMTLVGEKKYRIWQIYMAGSAWAFERGWLSIYQLLAGRPDDAGRVRRPWTREHMYAADEVARAAA